MYEPQKHAKQLLAIFTEALKKMHISLLTDGIYPYTMGGMQKHSYYLAKYLAQERVFVDVYFGIAEEDSIATLKELFTSEEQKFIRFCRVSLPKTFKFPGHYLWESYQYSKAIYESFLQSEPTDFIYIQGFAGWHYLKKYNIKHIPTAINFHGVEMFQKAPSFRVKLEHLLLRPFVLKNLKRSDYAFSLGGKLTALLEKLVPGKVIPLPIGITNQWLSYEKTTTSNGHRKLIFIGRYERRKGLEELNNVLQKLLKEQTKPFEMHFVGPIPESKQIRNAANIFYHGALYEEEKIQQILKECDLLLSPSWSEGMPTVILEAMASGCAIIATDVGAVSEQVDVANGYLIPAGDSPALEGAISTVLLLPNDQLTAMKTASVQKVKEKFLWEEVAKRTVMELKKMIG